jgi:hypothetical protein
MVAVTLIGGVDVTVAGGPAGEVVGEHGAGEPGGVGEEPTGWAVFESGTVFEVTDRQLDAGVVAVELVDGGGAELDVGDEGVVSPVGPQPLLGRVGEPGAAHHQPHATPVTAVWTPIVYPGGGQAEVAETTYVTGSSSKVASTRSIRCDTGFTGSASSIWLTAGFATAILPGQGHFSRIRELPHTPERWIEV